jgi:HD-GYP domain-containing protein (c-di-GMP phosphodiesterase class II)
VTSVVDVYEAVTSQRPYQRAKGPAEGVAVLREQVARGWLRRDLVEEFAALVSQGGPGR